VRLPKGPVLGHRPSPRRAVGPDIVSLYLGGQGKFGTILTADLRVSRAAERAARVLEFKHERSPAISGAEQTLVDRMAEGVARIG
jgi:alkyldihydroxyacetonephosphate synthase